MIRVGVVGLGFMGKTHFNCYKSIHDVQVAAVCDVDEKKLKDPSGMAGNLAGAEKPLDFSGVELYTNYDEMLAKAKLDAVMIAQTSADWTRNGARQKMSTLIQMHGAKWMEAVLCASDEMALGAIEALRASGYFKGSGTYVPVIGVDGTRFGLDAITDGSLLGTVRADAASQGKAVFDLAWALATGENPAKAGWPLTDGKFVLVPYRKVTKENVGQFAQ